MSTAQTATRPRPCPRASAPRLGRPPRSTNSKQAECKGGRGEPGGGRARRGRGSHRAPPVSSLPPPSGGRCDACGAQAGGAERGDAAPAHGKRPWPRRCPRRGVLGPGPRDQALGRGGWDWRGSEQRGRGQALCPEPCCTWRAGAAAGRRRSASRVSGGVHGVLLGVWIFASLRSERRHLSVSHCALVKTEHLVRISLSRRPVLPLREPCVAGRPASLLWRQFKSHSRQTLLLEPRLWYL